MASMLDGSGMPSGTLAAILHPVLQPGRWVLAEVPLRQVLADSALLLLVGGMAMLVLIIGLVVLESLLPTREAAPFPDIPASGPVPAASRRARKRPAPVPTASRRARLHAITPTDHALGRLVELQLGEPRILRASHQSMQLRLYGCRTCQPGADGMAQAPSGQPCRFEAEWIADVFRAAEGRPVQVREVACCRRGQDACDFEVRTA